MKTYLTSIDIDINYKKNKKIIKLLDLYKLKPKFKQTNIKFHKTTVKDKLENSEINKFKLIFNIKIIY